MKPRMRHGLLRGASRRVLPGVLVLMAAASAPRAAPDAGGDPPSLVVVVVVDQLPTARLDAITPLLSGGLGRLITEGRVYSRCAHAHAMTQTAPGHATLLSGLLPRNHGVIMNSWYDTEAHREVYCVEDPDTETRRPSFNEPEDRSGVSPGNLLGENLADLMKRRRIASKVFSVSGKDRSAVLTAGHSPDGAFWFNRATGGFTSNPSIVRSLPSWGEDFWGADPFTTQLYRRNIPDQWNYPPRREALADDYPYEADAFSRTAPHPVAAVSGDEDVLRRRARQVLFSPWGDWLSLQLAERILDHEDLGRDEAPDLLVVALSSADAVGHTYGPVSQEYLDTLVRLDSWLGEFMVKAEKAAAASGGVLFALSSDHGVLPLPETLPGGRRIDPRAMQSRLQEMLKASLAPESAAPLVESTEGGHIYFDRRALATHGIPIEKAVEEGRRILSGFWEISRVYRAADLASDAPGDPFLDLHRASWHPDRGGDLVVQPCGECLLTTRAEGTSHGTAYEYDRAVPMILMGKGIEAGRVDSACRTVDLAPTIAATLGLGFESPRDGVPLQIRGR